MTKEEKQLLLKDLCVRLPYWPNIKTVDDDDAYIVGLEDTEEGLFYVHILEDGDSYDTIMSVENFKPYLRPMSSMTEEEYNSMSWEGCNRVINYSIKHGFQFVEITSFTIEILNWLNANQFDYRGLIPMGLALEAPKGMY